MTAIPVPPLADLESARLFHRVLLLHVARLKCRGDPVGFDQFLLGQALGLHIPAKERELGCAECGRPYPCRMILLIALLTRLPVSWAPMSLARALSATALWPSGETDRDITKTNGWSTGIAFKSILGTAPNVTRGPGAGWSAPTSAAASRRPNILMTTTTCVAS